mgnify:CR=1 FL=1
MRGVSDHHNRKNARSIRKTRSRYRFPAGNIVPRGTIPWSWVISVGYVKKISSRRAIETAPQLSINRDNVAASTFTAYLRFVASNVRSFNVQSLFYNMLHVVERIRGTNLGFWCVKSQKLARAFDILRFCGKHFWKFRCYDFENGLLRLYKARN